MLKSSCQSKLFRPSLTSISGFVLEPLIRDISQLLRSGLSLSTAVPPSRKI